MSLIDAVLHFGRTRRDEVALIEGAQALSYGELSGSILRTAGHLHAIGLRRGNRVGLCLAESSDHLVTLLAVAHAGAVAVPLDWRAAPVENARINKVLDLAFVLKDVRARGVEGCQTISVDDQWHEQVARANPMVESTATWDDPLLVSATSGSTGKPKFTQTTHLQYYFKIAANWELLQLHGRHRCLATLPFYYDAGRTSCMTHLLRGDCLILYSILFTAAEFIEVANSRAATVAGAVPSTIRQLLAAAGEAPLLPNLQVFFATGGPLYPDEKREAARRLTPQFHEKYGSAETDTMSVLRPADLAERAHSVGRPHSLAEIEIVDEQHRQVPSGIVGALRYRAPGMGSPLPGGAGEASFRDGWFYAGEIACVDDAGYIFLQGRSSDVIIRGGAKIHPAEVEATLMEHPCVHEAAVLGQRGADNEEAATAFVVLKLEASAADLLAHCRMRLTAYKVPRQFHLVPALPKNSAGKIDKATLAQWIASNAAS